MNPSIYKAKFNIAINFVIEFIKALVELFLNRDNLVWKIILISTIIFFIIYLPKTLDESKITIPIDISIEEIEGEDAEWAKDFIGLLKLEIKNFHIEQFKRNQEIIIVSLICIFIMITSSFLIFYKNKLKIDTSKLVISRIANFLGHELLNELNVIELANSNLSKKYNISSSERSSTNLIESLKKCHLLLKRLMNLSHSKAKLEYEFLNFHDLVLDESYQYEINFNNIQFNLELDENIPIYGNYNEISNLIKTLLKNSIEAIGDKKGEISISSKFSYFSTIVYFKDNGIGIPEEIQNEIFKPAFTHGKANGNGLGLAAAKNTLSRMGGNIKAYQHSNMTVFELKLPRIKIKREKFNS